MPKIVAGLEGPSAMQQRHSCGAGPDRGRSASEKLFGTRAVARFVHVTNDGQQNWHYDNNNDNNDNNNDNNDNNNDNNDNNVIIIVILFTIPFTITVRILEK